MLTKGRANTIKASIVKGAPTIKRSRFAIWLCPKIWLIFLSPILWSIERGNFFGINCKSPCNLFTITLHTTKESTIERDDLADVFSAEHYMTCFLSYAQFKSKKTKTWMHSCNVIFILFSTVCHVCLSKYLNIIESIEVICFKLSCVQY